MEEHEKDPSKRIAQHRLAQEVLKLVHGEQLADETEREHRKLFNKSTATRPQTDNDDNQSTDDVDKAVPVLKRDIAPTHSLTLPKSLVYNQRISRVLWHAGLASSRNEGHRMVAKKGVYLGARPGGSGTMGEQVDYSPAANWEGDETEKYIIGGDTLIIRVGKWKVKIIKIVSDEEFEKLGFNPPGWKEDKPEEPMTEDLKNMKPWHEKKYVEKAPIHRQRVWRGV